MKNLLLVMLSVMLVGCAKHEAPCGLVAWWPQGQVSLVPPSDPQWYAAVERAAATWNDAVGAEVFVLDDDEPSVPILLVPSLEKPEQQAITSVRFAGPIIQEATVKINMAYAFSFSSPSYYQLDAESLVLHELGHVLGMPHRDDPASAMYQYLGGGQIRRTPSQDDADQVECAYGGR